MPPPKGRRGKMVITEEEIEFMLYIIAPKANEDILLDRIDYQLRL